MEIYDPSFSSDITFKNILLISILHLYHVLLLSLTYYKFLFSFHLFLFVEEDCKAAIGQIGIFAGSNQALPKLMFLPI